jgi:transcriptional regulator with PAS, ATPase and Fis domain/hypoxanthine-guanine phosphoribosyltransferase
MNLFFIEFSPDFTNHPNLLCDEIDKIDSGSIIIIDFKKWRFIPSTNELRRVFSFVTDDEPRNFIFINYKRWGKKELVDDSQLHNDFRTRKIFIPVFDDWGEFLCCCGISKNNQVTFQQIFQQQMLCLPELSSAIQTQTLEILSSHRNLFEKCKKSENTWKSKINAGELQNIEIKHDVEAHGAFVENEGIVLLSGRHTAQYILTFHLNENLFIEKVSKRIISALEFNVNFESIVTFSILGSAIAEGVKYRILKEFNKEIEVVCLENYRQLDFKTLAAEPIDGKRILIIIDVMDSGRLLQKIFSFCEKRHCKIMQTVAVIDRKNSIDHIEGYNRFISLCQWKIPSFDPEKCPLRIKYGKVCSSHIDELTMELSSSFNRDFNFSTFEELFEHFQYQYNFYKMVNKANALEWHVQIKSGIHTDRHYLNYFDAKKLLELPKIYLDLPKKITSFFNNINSHQTDQNYFPFDLIISADHDNALFLVQKIKDRIKTRLSTDPIKSIAIYGNKFRFHIKEEQKIEQIKQARRILIVDDGINTTETIHGLFDYLSELRSGDDDLFIFVLVDRLPQQTFNSFIRHIKNKNKYFAYYYTQLPSYVDSRSNCPECQEYTEMDSENIFDRPQLLAKYHEGRKKRLKPRPLPAKSLRESKADVLSQEIIFENVTIKFIEWKSFFLEIFEEFENPFEILKLMRNKKYLNLVHPFVEALEISDVRRNYWETSLPFLLNLAGASSYKVGESIVRSLTRKNLIDTKVKEFLREFIIKNSTHKETHGFFAWVLSNLNDAIFNKSLAKRAATSSKRQQVADIISGYKSEEFIIASSVMKNIQKNALKVAKTNVSVLVQGDTGTGKEMIARLIHYKSQRASCPFISVNCGAFSESLIESELFGHEQGAFTGAHKRMMGAFEHAHKGTIFLDEIDSLSLKAQSAILRLIEDHELRRVGGEKTQQIDTRIVTATNKDLKKMVDEGTFREDLYYRIKIFDIRIPPLRDRKEEIVLLLNYFLKKHSGGNPKIEAFSEDAMKAIHSYPWPGNIRELSSFVQQLVVLYEDPIISLNQIKSLLPETHNRDEAPIDWQSLKQKYSLDKKLVQVLRVLIENNEVQIDAKSFSDLINCSQQTARNHFNKLIEKGILIKKGKGPATFYELNSGAIQINK